jgi:hypothetical protein
LKICKISLDNTYWCDTLALVESCASAIPGRFAFSGYSRPSLAGLSKIPSALAKACANNIFAPPGGIAALVRSQKASSRSRGQKGAKMPSYQNVTPPISLMPGDVGFSFNNEAFPGAAQAGSQFAIPSYAGQPDTGTAVRWQTIFGTAPTAVSLVLQGAMADIDAEYQTIDTTTNTAGEARTVTGVQTRFLRIRFVSSTGGAGLTAKLMV